MNFASRRVLLILLIAGVVACQCRRDFTQRRQGEELMPGLRSYSSSEEAESGGLLRNVALSEHRNLEGVAGSPQFRVKRLESRFEHLGEPGVIRMTYYNDRLYGVQFFPDESQDYELALRAKRGGEVHLDSEPLVVGGNVRFWSGNESGRYFAWADWRLFEESAQWIECYAASPAPQVAP
jgi:hypothetical protein